MCLHPALHLMLKLLVNGGRNAQTPLVLAATTTTCCSGSDVPPLPAAAATCHHLLQMLRRRGPGRRRTRVSMRKPGLFFDLFSGTGSVSRAAGKCKFKVKSVDYARRPGKYTRKRWASIVGDINTQMVQHELSKLKPQTAWASIPCDEVSPAHTVNRQIPATTLRKVRIVKALFNKWAARAPRFLGIIENPEKGLNTLNPFPRYVHEAVCYCRYADAGVDGFDSKSPKPTSLWFTRPLPAFDALYCGASGRCPFAYKGPCGRFRHPQTAQCGRLSTTNAVGTPSLAERFHVPHRLVYALIRAANSKAPPSMLH